MRHIQDKLGRNLQDLRISVTDRCNFRCGYCMPADVFNADYPFLPRKELLQFEEIARIAKIFAQLGVRKIRLTGGEPLLRKHIEKLVAQLADIPSIDDIAMTTNASLLSAEKAAALKKAGLQRITISLDSLNDETFRNISDTKLPVAKILQGIENAANCGLFVKVNAVIKRGVNDQDILPLAQHFHQTPHILRFIEYMDVGTTNQWQMQEVVPAQEIVETIHETLPLEPVEQNYRGEVCQRFRYRDGGGEIGVIASVTQPFCQDCTRARISAQGDVYTCLFAQQAFPLKPLILRGASDHEIAQALIQLWQKRTDRYSELRKQNLAQLHDLRKVEMSHIGG